MIGWLRQRSMVGGLVFGPPAWSPGRIENTFDAEDPLAPEAPSPGPNYPACNLKLELPRERREAATFLEDLGIRRTSAMIPSLAEQLRTLRDEAAGMASEAAARGLTHPGWRVRALVLNLLPTQPEFALADALSRLALDDLLTGLHEIQRIVKAQRVIVAADHGSHGTLRAWKKAAKSRAAGALEIRGLLNRYPQAHPTILFRSLFGKRLAPDALPSRMHRVLIDAVTCWALGRWLRTGQAMTERPVQLFAPGSDSARHPHEGARLVMGRLGETIAAFCERFDVPVDGRQVILNGLLTGEQVDPAQVKITALTEAVAVRAPAAPESASACLSCGWCVDVCPAGLTPVSLLDLSRRAHGADINEHPSAAAALLKGREARESLHCIGCGLCSFVCPTRLPLMQESLALRLRVLDAARPGGAPR